MKKRWSISDDAGVSWNPVEPKNAGKHRITQERDLDSGLIAFRKKFSGGLLFTKADFAYLRQFAEDPDRRCADLFISLEFECSGEWQEFYRGKFSAGSCKWGLGNCEVEVKPVTVDKYTCLLEKSKVKTNILTAEQVHGGANIVIDVEWGYSYSWQSTSPGTMLHASQSGMVDGSNNPVNGWGIGADNNLVGRWSQSWAQTGTSGVPLTGLSTDGELTGLGGNATLISITTAYANAYFSANPGTGTVDFTNISLYRFVWWRQQFTVACEFGTSSPPPGSGWTLLDDNCGVDNTAIYAREPQIPYTFGDLHHGSAGPTPPVSPACTSWVLVDDFWFTSDPMYICYPFTTANLTTLDRGRVLESVVNVITDATGCGLSTVRSDFFEWDPPGDAPGWAPGVNYITGTTSQTNHLTIFQKSDVIIPDASTPATIGEMTFAELATMLRVVYRCYWDIDDDGHVRFEHWHYWQYQQGLDLPIMYGSRVNESLIYEAVGDAIPRIERAKWMEAQGLDFVGKDIVYSGPCVNSEDPQEWTPGKITTDIAFIFGEPEAISKDGFVLMACTIIDDVYIAIVDAGALSGQQVTNAPLSWANLERDFWTWDRYLPSGNMNGADVDFDGYLPNIEQQEIMLTLCCDLLAFNPSETIVSSLGERLDVGAEVTTAEHDLSLDRTTLRLRYSYG